jgi:hypothetical protein
MNKPQWHLNLEKLDDASLATKRKDILLCIQSCRKEALIGYNEQLKAVDEIIATRKQISLNFKPIVDDTQDNE